MKECCRDSYIRNNIFSIGRDDFLGAIDVVRHALQREAGSKYRLSILFYDSSSVSDRPASPQGDERRIIARVADYASAEPRFWHQAGYVEAQLFHESDGSSPAAYVSCARKKNRRTISFSFLADDGEKAAQINLAVVNDPAFAFRPRGLKRYLLTEPG